MDKQDGGMPPDLEEQSRVAGEMLERSLLRAVSSVETELTRVMRTGEADIERLAQRIAAMMAQLALDSVFGGGNSAGGDGAGSLNGIATAIARAARRGSRFT
jgi:phage-related minor tail protein